MDMDLHVEHREQQHRNEGAKRDDPPENPWNARRDIGEPGTPQLGVGVQLSIGLGVRDFLALLRRLEGHKVVDHLRHAMRPFRRDNATLLLRPCAVDHEPGVVSQIVLQFALDRLRISLEVAIERREA